MYELLYDDKYFFHISICLRNVCLLSTFFVLFSVKFLICMIENLVQLAN